MNKGLNHSSEFSVPSVCSCSGSYAVRRRPRLHTIGQSFVDRAFIIGLASLLLSGCGTTESVSKKPPPNQMAKHLRLKTQENLEINYLLFLPKGYDAKAQNRWPLIL